MTGSKVGGVVRLAWFDPQKQVKMVLWVSRTEPMSDNSTDITKQPIIPLYDKVFRKDDYLSLWLMADAVASGGVSAANGIVRVPVTFRNTRTGAIYDATIGVAGEYKFTFVSEGTSFVVAVDKEWGYYQIPAGLEMKLGNANAFNSRPLIMPYSLT